MNCLETVIFPVAGLGTRMLPATKVTPKELLPVYDTPLLQFALDEALAAGAKRIVLVSHPSKPALAEYLRPDPGLEQKLAAKGKDDLLRAVQASRLPSDVDLHIVMQTEQLGLGHAVLCGADVAGDGPVGVILPDDLMLGAPCLAEMTEAYDPATMRSLVAAQQVPAENVSRYGIFDCDESRPGATLPARRFVEKPAADAAPSRLAAVGRYILDESVFDVLRKTGRGAGGEIQLTDAIAAMGGIHAFRFSATRFDCGCRDGLVEATLAVQRARKRTHLHVAAE
ncbi:UTP--glucose-1-phosphate uridylyltransferase [Jannaschia pagri]|uniref:UTP--glucose-1-phosphate uridylyltransferase n=1 Tax=Jannaschia pagri TaxID=2829797 RepID=A0ABQ4NI70_9RHOB|nr:MULTISPECIES: UTP--glucose-1-phosphate uridylyltransferase [unclassified Jannaschia]GIT89779.1 UTP--glucose-1-phosphate uridylyltransferase [Jannaschia sp. AI_61]GIT94113.1 UTP--glucose-1-phosphate uridylyltransferase [Jannaschia sp. AI_62]